MDDQPPTINQQLARITEAIQTLGQRMDTNIERLDDRIGQLDTKIDTTEDRLSAKIGAVESGLNGQMLNLYQHMEERFDALEAKIDTKADADRVYAALDGIAERLDADDQERAAIISEQRRHGAWIGQLAKHTHTKLAPEP